MVSNVVWKHTDGILPELIQYLSVPNIRPHLKQAQLLTDDEYQRLEITPSNTTQDAVEKLVKFLKRKGPKHEQLFLQALQRSMASDCHLGHRHIIALLEQGIPAGNSTPDNDDLAQSNGMYAVCCIIVSMFRMLVIDCLFKVCVSY